MAVLPRLPGVPPNKAGRGTPLPVQIARGPAQGARALLKRLLQPSKGGEVERERDSATEEKIVVAATRVAESFGLKRFTIDDVARRLGVSRVTIYRYFPKKELLIEAVLMHELAQFLAAIEEHLTAFDSLEEKLVKGVVFALAKLRNHTLLNRLLRTEPEAIVPHLTLEAGPVLTVAREFIARYPRREVEAGRLKVSEKRIAVMSEMLARVVLSFVLTPDSIVKLESPDEIQAYASDYLAPVVRASLMPAP